MITFDDDIRTAGATPVNTDRRGARGGTPEPIRPEPADWPHDHDHTEVDATTEDPRDRRLHLSSLAATVALALVAMMVVATRVLGGEPVPAGTADRHLVAADLHDVVERSPGVRVASVAYVEGIGIVAYTAVDGVARADLTGWAVERIVPIAGRLGAYPAGEELVWLVDGSADGGYTESLVAPLASAADPSGYATRPAWRQQRSAAPIGGVSAGPVDGGATDSANDDPVTVEPEQPAIEQSVTEQPVSADPATIEAVSDDPQAAVPAGMEPADGQLSFDFSVDAEEWSALSGVWRVVDGSYRQLDDSGYDFASYLLDEVVTDYEVRVRMRALDGGLLNAGVMLNRPSGSDRAGTTMLDLTERGSFLRWGHFDESGRYTYVGGAPVTRAGDPTRWVDLRVTVGAGTGLVWLDDEYVGEFPLFSDAGRVGLVTSVAAVEFDDVVLTPTAPGQG